VPQPLRYALVAAGTLAASLLVQVLWWPPGAGPGGHGRPAPAVPALGYLATLTQAADCVWGNDTELWRVGARLPPSTLHLQKGIARIRFDSGAELTLEGPAAVRLDSVASATVVRGKVVFKGDGTGTPFDLHTPSSTLVDYGTEYAVAVGPEGEEVHVFDGQVRRTPHAEAGSAEPEELQAGQARRYGPAPQAAGEAVPLDQARFVHQRTATLPAAANAAAGLLAYEGFDYADPEALTSGRANGGSGWAGPWVPGFARPLLPGDQNLQVFNPRESLTRPGAAVPPVGGCFDYTGFTKYFRRLATPVRLDTEGVYYLSFLFRHNGPPADPTNAVAVLFWTDEDVREPRDEMRKRLNVGVGGANQLFTHLQGIGSRTPLPLSYGETYLLVAKIVASQSNPDQVFMRVYAPLEPIEREESGSWSVTGPPFQSDLVFDWLQLHVNSKRRQMIDEVRLGTTWASVTAPWIGAPAAR
jgi:hypothetical protein